jgi:hypothetical protein
MVEVRHQQEMERAGAAGEQASALQRIDGRFSVFFLADCRRLTPNVFFST